jgi:uncharacterized SAM-binding protein YcdF (DUF218 family)
LFILYKVLAFLGQPSTLAVLAIGAGLLVIGRGRRTGLGKYLAWGGLGYLVIGGLSPLGNVLVLPLEQRFSAVPPVSASDRLNGIIILGGFEDGWVSAGRNGLAVNESAERLTEGLRLARLHPGAKVVFTGGVGNVWTRGLEATGPIGTYFRDVGIEQSRVILEGRSRNTHENALAMADILKPEPGDRWLLVTSAYHMPRAVGLFRKVGFEVTPYPVDYRTRDLEDMARLFERIPSGLARVDLATNEWLGLLVSRMLGRIDEIFPAP